MLDEQPWHQIEIESRKNLLFKCFFQEEKYELLMFDLQSFQIYNSIETQIKKKCEQFNPKTEIPLSKIVACLQASFAVKKENCKFTLLLLPNDEECDSSASIKMNTKISG